jgi:four helix bundle protein
MGVSSHRDLHAWKMARELADRVASLADRGAFRRDRALEGQLLRSSRSVPANIAEGFGRFSAADFARFLRIARGSALETQEYLHEARTRLMVSPNEAEELETLCRRTLGSIVPLIKSLGK